MSADLLAEFDSFYQAPQDVQPDHTPASNDLAFLASTNQLSQPTQPAPEWTQWQAQQTNSNDIWGDMASFQSIQPTSNHGKTKSTSDDVWGSFEAADPAPKLDQYIPKAVNFGGPNTGSQRRNKSVIIRRPTLDLFSKDMNNIESLPNMSMSTKPEPIAVRKPELISKSSFGEVLFDAVDEFPTEQEEDDDFGDFESFAGPAPPVHEPSQPFDPFGMTALSATEPPIPTLSLRLTKSFGATALDSKTSKTSKRPKDLLSTSSTTVAGMLPYPQAPKSPSFQERNPFGQQLGLAMDQAAAVKKADKIESTSPVTAWPDFNPPKPDPYQDSPLPVDDSIDEGWGDFADLPPESPGVATARPTSGIEADAWAWDVADKVSSKPVNIPPPTNVPPPSVLLTLFPPLFDLPQSTLFKGVVNQPFSLKNRILSDPSTISFLRAYLLIGVVATRIIAGRKLRWKRDTILSQAMKIGPAAAGGKGGMKLAGVDKAEVTREDREAADVVRVWKDQLGRLRSTVAVANSSLKDTSRHLVIPDLTETMHVKSQEGGLTAPKPCVICGLKREERINKVDLQVEDSFGEWWIDHWGHRACKNFWQEHESRLKHR